MTKVLFISNDPKLFDAGSAVRARMREYAAMFDELHVISRFSRGVAGGVREENLTIHSVSGFFSMFFRARRIVRMCGIDVVSTQDPFEHGLMGLMVRGRAKLHVQLHTDIFSPHFRFHPWWNVARLWVARFVFKHTDGIRVVSQRLADALHTAHYALRVNPTVLPIFTDVEKFRNLPRLKHPRFKIALLVVSRLEKEKNVALALRALKQARDAGHDAGLTVVGDGRERRRLANLARSLGLERFIEFVGWKIDTTEFLKTADLLLFPSLYDGYGMAIVEALAAGVPVLATDVGVAREAGAMVTSKEQFPAALVEWCSGGPRRGELQNYPYKDKDDYLHAFKNDIELCASKT